MALEPQSEYKVLDKLDEEQIKNAGQALKQALIYEIKIKGKPVKQITFIGLKWLTVKMSQKGQSLQIINSEVKLEKDDPDKKDSWQWRSIVRVQNMKTGLETEGVAECPYLEKIWIYKDNQRTEEFKLVYDPFGRTKAHSKSERNAWRKQIPEVEIIELLNTAEGKDTHQVKDEQTKFCNCLNPDITPDKGGCRSCKKALSPEAKKTAMEQ